MLATIPSAVTFDAATCYYVAAAAEDCRSAAPPTTRQMRSVLGTTQANGVVSSGVAFLTPAANPDFDTSWSFALSASAFRLGCLEPGWDGPGSKAIAKRAIFMAETLVRVALEGRPLAAAPYLVPGGDGSVQIEWHERTGEIELSVDTDGHMSIWGRSHVTGQEFEGEGEKALALFSRWAPRLAASDRNVVDVEATVETLYSVAA